MKIALLLLGLALCLSPALSGIPIPNTPDGYQQGSNDAPVVFEFFGDLMCPVTAAVYPTMKQIISHYGPNKLKFLFHAYSLPYHRNAFLSNKGTWVIAANNISNVFTYIESVMAHQVDLFNAPSANMSTNDVLNYLAKLVETDGLMTAAQFLAGMDDDNVDLNAIGSWKYGASRAVTGTPTTIVNGAVVDSDSSWTLSDWQQVLDPLYPAAHQLTCPSGSVACDYAPGKEECCLAGEFCIKNEGCTCAKDMSKLACRARAAAANSTCHTGFTACHSEAGAQCCMAGEFCEKKKGCTRKEHADALSCAAEPKDMMAKETCTPPNVPCEYLPGKTQCCLPGEMCLHNVGCRCALGEKHVKPMKMVPAKKHSAPHAPQPLCKARKAGQIDAGQCTAPNVPCQYLPGKTQCCLPGEACIHNVGCRCAVEEQKPKEEPKASQPLCKARKVGQVDAGQCTAPNVPCQYLPGKTQCCLPGEACIHNVGCRCAVEEQKPKEEKETPRPLCRSRKAGQVDAGQCAAPNVPCEYLPGKTQCCLPGEACIHNVGCRCAVEEKPKKAHKSPKAPQPLCRHRKAGQIDAGQCTPPNVPCEYLPGKTQCCLAGEACIHNVGCRCAASLKQDEDVIFPPHDETALCNVDPKKDAFAAPPKCPDTQFPCEYLKDKWSCCFAGDFCIRNVGCQC